MSFIALELPRDVAIDLQREGLLGAGGSAPGRPQIFECLLSDLEWPAVETELATRKAPFKVQLPGSTERRAVNGPTW